MYQLAIYASLLAVVLAGVASGSSLWTRKFDPETVERPVEEYREAYRRHLLERREDVPCTEDDYKGCGEPPAGGWTLHKQGVVDLDCSPVGDHETEHVFFVTDKKKPCCKFHGCVVSDCAKLQAEFRYDESKECTRNDEEGGPIDKCRTRVTKKTCGCTVHECEIKSCPKNVKCGECESLSNKVNECGCQTKESCVPKPPTPGRMTCTKDVKCEKCHHCVAKNKIWGQKCADKFPKELDKSYCEPDVCPANQECDACQNAVSVSNEDGCCKRIECKPVPELECTKPNANTGKCDDQCLEPVNKLIAPGTACKKTVKCCEQKKCAEKPAEKCDACHVDKEEKDKCGCKVQECKLDPALAMCKQNVKYTVKVKTGGADSPRLAFLTALEKATIPQSSTDAKIKLTGACTPEQINDPSVEMKECVVVIPGTELTKSNNKVVSVEKACENIGIIKKIDIESNGRDVWFIEEVTIETPKDTANPDEKIAKTIPVEKFLGKPDPSHVNWDLLHGWEATTEVSTGLAKGKSCTKCQEFSKNHYINCTSLNDGKCVTKECSEPGPCASECDFESSYKDDCNCAKISCTPTYPKEYECKEGEVKKTIVNAKCTDKEVICEPVVPCENACPKQKDPECEQCSRSVIVQDRKVVDGKACICQATVCEPFTENCLTKEEAQKRLKCTAPCQEAKLSEEVLECGCKKWVCADIENKCDKCDECSECKKVYSSVCERPIFDCVKKGCATNKNKNCMIPVIVNGKEVFDQCDCPKYKNKPCSNDPVHVCKPGEDRVQEGEDGCGCPTSIRVPCEQKVAPVCNGTCHHLVETSDGCCKTWKCEKTPCPKKEDITCPECHTVTVHEDECECCKSTCTRTPCPGRKRCLVGQKPVLTTTPCGCEVLLRCTPEGGSVTPGNKDKDQCKKCGTKEEFCTKCED